MVRSVEKAVSYDIYRDDVQINARAIVKITKRRL